MCCAQLDIPALYRHEGDAPVRALQAALAAAVAPNPNPTEPGANANGISAEPAGGAPPADAAALRSALGGLVWTPSLRRMYTLLDRCRPALCPGCGVQRKGTHMLSLAYMVGSIVRAPSLRCMCTLLMRCCLGSNSTL